MSEQASDSVNVSVVLPRETLDQIKKMAEVRGMTLTAALITAVSLGSELVSAAQRKEKVILESPDGTKTRLTWK